MPFLIDNARGDIVLGAKIPQHGNPFTELLVVIEALECAEIHLRKPSTTDGPRINSDIGRVAWVEATQYESEVPKFYTKYLATVWDRIALLVTFSAHKDSWDHFQSLIVPCIKSLEVKDDWKKK